jgi:hypothetical protein
VLHCLGIITRKKVCTVFSTYAIILHIHVCVYMCAYAYAHIYIYVFNVSWQIHRCGTLRYRGLSVLLFWKPHIGQFKNLYGKLWSLRQGKSIGEWPPPTVCSFIHSFSLHCAPRYMACTNKKGLLITQKRLYSAHHDTPFLRENPVYTA